MYPVERGPKVEAIQHHRADLPEQKPGEHLGVVTGAWRVRPVPDAEYQLDTENLLTLDGPGCMWCEELWKPGMESAPCRPGPGTVPAPGARPREAAPKEARAVPTQATLEEAEVHCRKLADWISKDLPPGWLFSVWLFAQGEQGFSTYVSNVQRPDFIKAMRELADHLERGTPPA